MCVGVDGGATAPANSNVFVWNCFDGGQQWLPNYQQRLTNNDLCLASTARATGPTALLSS
jgi:hypothetical protein